MTALSTWNETSVEVAGGYIPVLKGGTGQPLLVLPRDNADPWGQTVLDLLAERFSVLAPRYPGYAGSDPDAWSWLADVRDLTAVLLQLLAGLRLDSVTVLGMGFGGWLAAEMATMCTHQFSKLILVSPMGIQPQHGAIFDQFIVNTETYARAGFYDQRKFDEAYGSEPGYEQLERWETAREMTSRIGWKPYMYNRSLPRLLHGVSVPTLVVWGRDDEIVPVECAQLYAEALQQADLQVFDNCGHAVDVEEPGRLAALVQRFLET